jgi:hypothetical protein
MKQLGRARPHVDGVGPAIDVVVPALLLPPAAVWL